MCLVTHERLGVERDAEPGRREHVEVVGAVADRDGVADRYARLFGEVPERVGLAGTVDDITEDATGEVAVDDLQVVRGEVVDAQLAGDLLDDLGESAADQGESVAE